MPVALRECPHCGREMSAANLSRHIEAEHPETMPDPEFSVDEPPAPRKAPAKKAAAPKKAAVPKTPAGGPSLADQLALPYHLAGDMTRTRMPQTSMALHANAAAAGAAWDRFLMRYPSLRDKIATGMIGADVLALVMVHVEILRVAREEIAAQREAMQHYEGGLEQRPAA